MRNTMTMASLRQNLAFRNLGGLPKCLLLSAQTSLGKERTFCTWHSPERHSKATPAFQHSHWAPGKQDRRRTHRVLSRVCSDITFPVRLFLKKIFHLLLLQGFSGSFTEGFKKEFSIFSLALQAANKSMCMQCMKGTTFLCSLHGWSHSARDILQVAHLQTIVFKMQHPQRLQ